MDKTTAELQLVQLGGKKSYVWQQRWCRRRRKWISVCGRTALEKHVRIFFSWVGRLFFVSVNMASPKFCVKAIPKRQRTACKASTIWDFLLIAILPKAEAVCAP